ncbi:MAG TPA: hypothetical protein VL172_04755, partial [Kofleriaceae bacterium]|nr:hypothetical protein [Kofleriaceae bacterium]
MRRVLAAALVVACSSKAPPAEPPKPPPDAAVAPADAAEPPDAGEDLAKVRQVAFADVIKTSYGQVQRCWEKAAADDFHLAGTVKLSAHFGAGGKLDRIEVVADGAGDGVLTACLVQVYQDAAWQPVFEPDTAIEFPVKFEQPGAQYTVRRADVAGGKLLAPANTGNPAFELLLGEST